MALSTFERSIVGEIFLLTGKRIKEKELFEWSTGELKPQAGEQVLFLKICQVWVCIPK